MIVIRLALPVRSPMPLTVPCTCVAPASTAVSVLATAQPESSCAWMPSATPGSACAHDRQRRAHLRAAASRRWCRTAPRARRPASAAARSAVQRVAGGRARSRRRSARRRTARACPARTRKAIESPIIARFSSRETRTTFSTCSSEVLPTSVQTGAKRLGEHAQPLVVLGGDVAPAGHAEGDDLGALQLLARRAARTARCSLGLDAGKPASIKCDAERVERVHDAQLLLGRERHARRRPCRRAGWRRRAVCRPLISPPWRRAGARRGASPRGRLQRGRLHDVEPLAVALGATVDGVVEGALQHARDLARLARADLVVVDLAHRHELGGGARQEDLVGEVHLGARDVALDHRVAEVLRRSG